MNLWYKELIKPPLTPPAEYFPAAWGILYTMMTVSFLIIIVKKNNKDKYAAVMLFCLQLVLNFLWSYFFFELQSIRLALFDVILLLIILILTIFQFFKISKIAGLLLIPYLLQVIFALYLNTGLLILNSAS